VKKFRKTFSVGDKEYSFFFAEAEPPKDYPAFDGYVKASVGTFEDEEQIREKYFYPYLKEGEWFFDIGAGFGSYTLPALAVGCNVVAWSPEEDGNALEKNIKLNGYPTYHTSLNKGSAYLYRTGLYDMRGWFDPGANQFTNEEQTSGTWIKCEPLDELFDIGDITLISKYLHYLKIDAEGAELPILRGAKGWIKQFKPKMLVENHLFRGKEIEQRIIDYVDSLGLGYKHDVTPYHAISLTFFNAD
jgi:FkbM family methyltransferase